MLGYICGVIFKGVLDGTKGDLCHQPEIPPPTAPPVEVPEWRRNLLTINCVSIHLAVVYCPLELAVSDLRIVQLTRCAILELELEDYSRSPR